MKWLRSPTILLRRSHHFLHHTAKKQVIGTNKERCFSKRKTVAKYTVPVSARVSHLKAYLAGSGAGSGDGSSATASVSEVRGILYNDDGATGNAGSLVAQTVAVAIPSPQARWVTLEFETPILLEAGNYWIGTHCSGSTNWFGTRRASPTNQLVSDGDSFADGADSSFGTAEASVYTQSVYLEYQATQGDAQYFSIHGLTGQLSLARAVLDFETKNTYSFGIMVTDDHATPLSATATVTISITDVNEPPVLDVLSITNVAENTSPGTNVGSALSSSDPESDTVFYSLLSDPSGQWNVVGDRIQVKSALDFETKASYTLLVRATDTGGLSTDNRVMITLANVNEAPEIVGGSRTIKEDVRL